MTALTDPDLFRQQALVDGKWIDAASGKTVDVVDPASGRTIGTIPDLGRDETKRAIAAAEKAFASFRRTTHASRAVQCPDHPPKAADARLRPVCVPSDCAACPQRRRCPDRVALFELVIIDVVDIADGMLALEIDE